MVPPGFDKVVEHPWKVSRREGTKANQNTTLSVGRSTTTTNKGPTTAGRRTDTATSTESESAAASASTRSTNYFFLSDSRLPSCTPWSTHRKGLRHDIVVYSVCLFLLLRRRRRRRRRRGPVDRQAQRLLPRPWSVPAEGVGRAGVRPSVHRSKVDTSFACSRGTLKPDRRREPCVPASRRQSTPLVASLVAAPRNPSYTARGKPWSFMKWHGGPWASVGASAEADRLP